MRAIVGDGALDYALVLAGFHFINRVADLLHVDPEALPTPLRRIAPLRRLSVRAASVLLGRMDLANRVYDTSYAQACVRLAPLVERTRALTDAPLYAGFGISTPAQAAAAADLADGIVVGSAALLAAEDGAAGLERFVAQLRAVLT